MSPCGVCTRNTCMSRDTEFTPKLGKIRNLGGRRGKGYVQRVLRVMALAGKSRSGKGGFTGKRYGRGAGIGSVLAARERSFRQRRVIIKSRIIKMRGKGLNAARVHLRYIQRDGV